MAADYLGLPSDGETGRLYHNEGGTFRDVTKAANLSKVVPAMGLNFGDLDNDGWLDFYVGTGNPDFSTLVPKRMFRNDGGKRFQSGSPCRMSAIMSDAVSPANACSPVRHS